MGWQQIEEDSPNTATWHHGDGPPTPRTRQVELDELKKAASPDEAWADELARALRFLSVDVGGEDDDDDDDDDGDGDGGGVMDTADDAELGSTTQLVLAPAPLPALSSRIPASAAVIPGPVTLRPAVTVSSPVVSSGSDSVSSRRPQEQPPTPPSTTATPPPGASKITSVKATFEAMLPRQQETTEDDQMNPADEGGFTRIGVQRFIPTARPPVL